MHLSVTLQLCVSITAVATMLQGATTIYWTVVVLQERTEEGKGTNTIKYMQQK